MSQLTSRPHLISVFSNPIKLIMRWRLPLAMQSLRGGFILFLIIFCLLQCASLVLLTRLVEQTKSNVATSQSLTGRQSLLDKARMELLIASDNSNRAAIYLMQDNQTGSVDSWVSLADSAESSIESARTLFNQYQPSKNGDLQQAFDLLMDGLKEQLKGLRAKDIDAFFMVPMQVFQQQFNQAYYQTLNQARGDTSSFNSAMLESLMQNRNRVLAISALLLTLLLIAGGLLVQGVIVPLNRLKKHTAQIATGNIAHPVVTSRLQSLELKALTASIDAMQHGLRNIVGEINTIANAVLSSAGQISTQNEEFSSHSQQQNNALDHISQRLNRVAEEVEASVVFSQDASARVQAADSLTQRCGGMVAEVDKRMRNIVDASGEIAGIVTLLDSLSLQTKLLALNAAIESAHAGIYGRSFSVVAKEIGLLSEKSAASTRNIDELINRTNQHIESGFSQVTTLETLYSGITSAVSDVVVLLDGLQQNASAQSNRVNTIATEIAALNQQVRNSERLTAASASAAENLITHSQRLSHSVSLFVLQP
ncbi:chemoreceptor [Izhakiella australiensis]|uniref:Chemoreceptor n=1 Tax=Izhakiella australiensis TaxID=1926881 RepID=A0A1S8Y9S2_9GAMM|nr:methyl-accepting chemotaxis protein [Izhakiella australiensis]OON35592.1 chemoreceptor [Izhakiella australiensis]